MYYLIVALLLLPTGVETTVNYTAIPFASMENCETFLEDKKNKSDLTGSLEYYLDYQFGAKHGVKITSMYCLPEDELDWNDEPDNQKGTNA